MKCPRTRYLPPGPPLALTVTYAAGVAALIFLRVRVVDLKFLSMGWILVLAVIPLVPWLIPPLSSTVRAIAPLVKAVKVKALGSEVEVSLQRAARPVTGLGTVEVALTSDHLVHGLMATASPFSSTDALTIIEGVKVVRQSRADAVTVDLGEGAKWRLPNLYFLAWVFTHDPVTRWLVFTETRAGTTRAFVGMCTAADLYTYFSVAYPPYATVSQTLKFYDPTDIQNQQQLADEFNKMVRDLRASPAAPGAGEPPTMGWVTAEEVRSILGPQLGTTSINWVEQLDRIGLEAIVRSPAPYVAATTSGGRFHGLIEQREVILEFTRRVIQLT